MTHVHFALAAAPRGALAVHLWHGVESIGFLLIAVASAAVTARRRDRTAPSGSHKEHTSSPTSPMASLRERTGRHQSTLLSVIAVAAAGAAAVHYVVMPTHFTEATLYGAFFLLAASAQLGYALLVLLRPSRALIVVGVIGNMSMVLLWLLTRTVAIPLGPAAGTTETFGGLDILASCFEAIVVVVGSVALASRGPLAEAAPRRVLRNTATIGLTLLAAVTVAATAAAAPPS